MKRESLKYDGEGNLLKKRVTVPLGQGWKSDPKEEIRESNENQVIVCSVINIDGVVNGWVKIQKR